MRHRSFPLCRSHVRAGLCFTTTLLGLGVGLATTAHAHGGITSSSCSLHADNGLRATCSVTLSAAHIARVGIRVAGSGDPWRWGEFEPAATNHSLEVWNMVEGTTYDYRIQVGPIGHGVATTGTLPTPWVPPNVEDMAFSVTSAADSETDYVLFNAGCSGEEFFIVVNRAGDIVWYQEIDLVAGSGTGNKASGFNVSDDGTGQPTILAGISQRETLELAFDGSTLQFDDHSAVCSGSAGDLGPCPHHDIARPDYTDDVLWVSAGIKDVSIADSSNPYYGCSTDHFVDDGVVRRNSSWSGTVSSMTLMNSPVFPDRYKPVVDAGPTTASGAASCSSGFYDGTLDYWAMGATHDHIDWTHVNAVFPTQIDGTEYWFLSLRMWDQLVKYDPAAGTIDWALSPWSGYTDHTLSISVAGDATFYGQHNVSVAGDPAGEGYLQIFDNREGAAGRSESNDSRVLRIGDIAGGSATIQQSFVLRDLSQSPMYCSHQGSGVTMPTAEDHVLALCNATSSIVELDESDGNITRGPRWILEPSGQTCYDLSGFYRAYPLEVIGFD